MPDDLTIPQGSPERRQSKEMSLKRGRPPTQIAGYEPERFLGMGAYGEVWVEVQNNTGRRVAIKFYAHRGGLDWSLLSREVEKLAFLFADRYVVQLIGVGWDAEPPYYIMEYLEHGSLAERLEEGPLSTHEAVSLFHDVAVGLVHAHGKGVLHCDLKPANILLDQDGKPRLADFGQSRLSHEQAPALGTLFYMAPEQADMDAMPDARWDVYALGAVLYCMLTGSPPHRDLPEAEKLDRSGDLSQRLAQYRRMLRRAPPPRGHRQVPGVDGDLCEILERCLAIDPHKRYPNVQAVLDALAARSARIARRPMMLFGTLGPMLLLLVVLGLTWWGSSGLMAISERELMDRTLKSTDYAAEFGGRGLEAALERRFNAVDTIAKSTSLQTSLAALEHDPKIAAMLKEFGDPKTPSERTQQVREQFIGAQQRRPLQEALDRLRQYSRLPETIGWFVTDARGVQVARYPEEPGKNTLGKCYAWRTYFHGGLRDQPPSWRPGPEDHVKRTQISAFYQSQATGRWVVTISAPIFDRRSPEESFLGIVGLMVDANEFDELKPSSAATYEAGTAPQQFYAIVDWRDGDNKGRIVQHDLYDRLIREHNGLPARFLNDAADLEPGQQPARFCLDELPESRAARLNYHDPLAQDEEGSDYQGRWLVSTWHVVLNRYEDGTRHETGLLVLAQTNYQTAIGDAMDELGRGLFWFGLLATASMLVVIAGMWVLAFRLMNSTGVGRRSLAPGDPGTQRPSGSMTSGSARSGATPGDATAATEPLPPGEPREQGNDQGRSTKQ